MLETTRIEFKREYNDKVNKVLGFLQIPTHGRHPCPLLTVPAAKSVADFRRLVTALAERTKETLEENFFLQRLFARKIIKAGQ